MSEVLVLEWRDFDAAVQHIAANVSERPSGVFGVARGGLPLAVALSHALEAPLVGDPLGSSLIVDDVVETGHTIARLPSHDPARFWAWVNKSGLAINAVRRVSAGTWVVFPWERLDRPEQDAKGYYAARQ